MQQLLLAAARRLGETTLIAEWEKAKLMSFSDSSWDTFYHYDSYLIY